MENQHSEEVKRLLQETKVWVLSTCDEKPNAIPVFFTSVKGDELIIFDVFMSKTLENLNRNSNVSVTVFSDSTMEGYQIKGIARHSTDTSLLDEGNAAAAALGLSVKGALVIAPQEIYVLTPGPDNGKRLM
ncbi:MAG: pyridoxamine 5'-phosphate oxidase family protein [Clostridiales Family XIII bacterium]|nr:pyridoxamine 5'-phosphate oxidase family protein [Clostridiales Family XIII bacterium]